MLPIITDDAHRSRIRQAQGRYVLATAADALGVLLAYISTRSENLNRLHTEAQRRADGTAIAVEELLQSLESSFATVRQRLHDSRQGIETGTFAVEAIVTSQAINESQGPTLRKLEGDIREALERRLSDVRRPTWRRVRRQYMARTRGWFPAKGNVDVDTLLGWQFDVGSDGTGLASASTKCARGILRVVNQQLTAAIASSIQHLRSTSEAWEIGTSARDIEFSLEKFERTHDDSVRSFYAYVSAPSSSDLLREHGFVGFDESGEQAVRTESIDALNCLGFAAISRASESCKERLRLVRREDPEDLDRSLDEDEERSIEDGAFGDGYRDHVANRVNVVCQQRVDELVSGLSERVDRFVKDVGEERTRVVSLRARIWRARATLVGRFAVVAISLSGVLFDQVLGHPAVLRLRRRAPDQRRRRAVQSHAEGTDHPWSHLPQHRGAAGRRPRLRRTLQCPVDRRKERLPEPRSSSSGVARRDLNQARRVRQTCVQGTGCATWMKTRSGRSIRDGYRDHVANRVNVVCQQRVDELVSGW